MIFNQWRRNGTIKKKACNKTEPADGKAKKSEKSLEEKRNRVKSNGGCVKAGKNDMSARQPAGYKLPFSIPRCLLRAAFFHTG
jgi:hypothetical protein